MKPPPPPDTPKETPMAHGRYAMYDDRAILEHLADEMNGVKLVVAAHTTTLAHHDGNLAELVPLARVAFQRPALSRPAQFVVAFAAALAATSLVVLAFAAVLLVRAPAAAAAPQPSVSGTQAVYRVP